MSGATFETASHGGKSATSEGLKMPKLEDMSTGQVEAEARREGTPGIPGAVAKNRPVG